MRFLKDSEMHNMRFLKDSEIECIRFLDNRIRKTHIIHEISINSLADILLLTYHNVICLET